MNIYYLALAIYIAIGGLASWIMWGATGYGAILPAILFGLCWPLIIIYAVFRTIWSKIWKKKQ